MAKQSKAAANSGTIRKKTVTRNGKDYSFWEARVTVGYDPGTGKQIQKSFSGKTQKKVREKLTAAQREIDRGTYLLPSKQTVSQWMNEWLETYCKNTVKPLTYSAYQTSIKVHITPAIGSTPIQSLKGVHIQKLFNGMLDAGLSPKTIKNTAAIMHKAFSVAVKQGIMYTNPCDAADLPKTQKTEIRPLQDSEIPQFLAAIDSDSFRNIFALCLFAGMREGECLGLSWDNVDFESQRITVCQQLQRHPKTGEYYIANSTKSGKTRIIEPPRIAFQYLMDERKKQITARLKAGHLWQGKDNLVFTTELGGYIAAQTLRNHFRKIAKQIGADGLRVHDLRHTAATVAISSGADIKSVQDLLGHATASFTLNVYAHTSDKTRKDTASRVQSYYDNLKKA